MDYKEFQPPAYFSQHIECYWEMKLSPGELDSPFELLSPDCTFDILFTDQPFFIKSYLNKSWKKIIPGATFFGQKTSSVSFSVKQTIRIFGIRFKPFAFANLIKTPLYLLNNEVLALNKLFELDLNERKFIQLISTIDDVSEKIELAEMLLFKVLKKSFNIDQSLRAQFNYILERKGLIRVDNLFTEFGISKVTLRKHFIYKMGLSPKKVSRIWRINHFLQLKKSNPGFRLTELCLESGFYDQAHFIKEFKYFFGIAPRDFFRYDSQLIKISQEVISRRFSNQYDPR